MFTPNCYNVQNRVGTGLSIYKNKIEALADVSVYLKETNIKSVRLSNIVQKYFLKTDCKMKCDTQKSNQPMLDSCSFHALHRLGWSCRKIGQELGRLPSNLLCALIRSIAGSIVVALQQE